MPLQLEEVVAVIEALLTRVEMIKATQQVMCTKAGLDWDAVCAKARQRIEAQDRVQAQLEAEARLKADKERDGLVSLKGPGDA